MKDLTVVAIRRSADYMRHLLDVLSLPGEYYLRTTAQNRLTLLVDTEMNFHGSRPSIQGAAAIMECGRGENPHRSHKEFKCQEPELGALEGD